LECILLHNTFPSAAVFSFYIFTFLMFRKLNKPQLTKNKQQNFIGIRAFDSRLYLDISWSFKWIEAFMFRYFKVFQLSQLFTYGLSDLVLLYIYKTPDKYFWSGIIYVQNWRVCELLKCILAIQKQLTNRPQVIPNQTDHRWTFGTIERPWNI
jgi:hypothetical protein